MSKFQVGDEVMLKDPHDYRYHGKHYPDLAERVRAATGTIAKIWSGPPRLLVRWHIQMTPEENTGWGIDEACVTSEAPPISEEEMAEVYRILGVSDG